MLDLRVIGALGIAAALAPWRDNAGVASPILGIELIESGYGPSVTTSTSDPLNVFENLGHSALTSKINNLVTTPLSIDLGSLNVSTNTAGTLTIIASATGLHSPLGLTSFSVTVQWSFHWEWDLGHTEDLRFPTPTQCLVRIRCSLRSNGTGSPFSNELYQFDDNN